MKEVPSDVYEVYVCSSPMWLPLSFAVHTWFVVNDHGVLHRWDGGNFGTIRNPNLGVFKDFLDPFSGMKTSPLTPGVRWNSRVVAVLRGQEAWRVGKFLFAHAQEYPYKDVYSLSGLNSNTFTQWVLDACGCV